MFKWLQEYLQKPMIEQTIIEEIFEFLIIVGIGYLIWLMGEIAYSLELKYKERKHKTR